MAMTARKIEAMHILYGKAEGCCRDCPHLVSGRYHDRILTKCEAYGLTHSEATDWRKKWECCGLQNRDLPDELPVIERLKRERNAFSVPVQIEGQIGIDELMKGGDRC